MQTPSAPVFLRSFVLALTAMALAVFAVTEAFDPFGENSWQPWPSPVRYASRVLTAGAMLHRLDRESYALVFGTSRSAMVSAAATGEPTLNLYSIYGNPRAVLDFLNRLDGPRSGHVREIFYLLDRHTFCQGCGIEEVDYTSFWSVLLYKLAHFPETANRLPLDLIRNIKIAMGRADLVGGENGALLSRDPAAFDGSWTKRPIPPFPPKPFEDGTLALLGEIDALAHRRGWTIHYYVPTLPDAAVAGLDHATLAAEKRRFLKVLPGYHDLSRIEGISEDPANFSDAHHLNTMGARRAICALRSERYLVTREEAGRIDPALGWPGNLPPLPAECRGRETPP